MHNHHNPEQAFIRPESTTLVVPREQHIQSVINRHFSEAEQRIDQVYRTHFHGFDDIAKRHWRHRSDIPNDLLALPRNLLGLLSKLAQRPMPPLPESGKQREIQTIIAYELLDLPGLERKLEAVCHPFLTQYENELARLGPLTADQRACFEQYLAHQMERLSMPVEGARDGLIAVSLMLTGKAIGDKAMISSAASVGSTIAHSVYLSHQSWWSAFMVGWLGNPGWVGWIGAGSGIVGALLLAPLIAPGVEFGVNRLRARQVLADSVHHAAEQITRKDGVVFASQVSLYLQILPDILHFLSKLRAR